MEAVVRGRGYGGEAYLAVDTAERGLNGCYDGVMEYV